MDTGAEVSVLPPSSTERKRPSTSLTLHAVNDSRIATFGTRSLSLELGLRRSFRWVFVLADVAQPILGADFLRHFNLLVDMKHCQLVDPLTQLKLQGISSKVSTPSPSLLPRTPSNQYESLLSNFPSLTQPQPTNQPPKHNVTHHNNRCPSGYTNSPPLARTPSNRTQRIRTHDGVGYHQTLLKQLGICSPHGPKENPRGLAPLWGLLSIKPYHRSRPLPNSTNSGFCLRTAWVSHIQQARPSQSLQSDPSGASRCAQDGSDHPIWPV